MAFTENEIKNGTYKNKIQNGVYKKVKYKMALTKK